jgi:shikimate kinase
LILKLKRSPGIYLVGFMASGKTTIGRLLAERLGWAFADLDEDIEAAAARKVPEIFRNEGEAAFREKETAALRARIRGIAAGRPMVLALGGGAFVQAVNADLIERHGISIWLDAPLELVKRRAAAASHRPLAQDSRTFEKLFEERRAAYARADFAVAIEGDDPTQAVEAILALPIF